MVDERFIQELVRDVVPDAEVHATDLTGGGDHWHVAIVSPRFEGQRSFQRQRPVLAAVTPHMQTGAIHAFDVKCITPAELREKHHGQVPPPFVPHQGGEGDHPASWD